MPQYWIIYQTPLQFDYDILQLYHWYKYHVLLNHIKYLNSHGLAVINSRLLFFDSLINILKKKKINYIVYGKKDIFFSNRKQDIILNIYKNRFKIKNNNFSEIDIQNLECAIACCLKLNISATKIFKSIQKIKPPSKLKTIENKNHKIEKYSNTHLLKESNLFFDWYLPLFLNKKKLHILKKNQIRFYKNCIRNLIIQILLLYIGIIMFKI